MCKPFLLFLFLLVTHRKFSLSLKALSLWGLFTSVYFHLLILKLGLFNQNYEVHMKIK